MTINAVCIGGIRGRNICAISVYVHIGKVKLEA